MISSIQDDSFVVFGVAENVVIRSWRGAWGWQSWGRRSASSRNVIGDFKNTENIQAWLDPIGDSSF